MTMLSRIICTTLLATIVVVAQTNRERVALAYEQSGDWRNAARLWQELLQQQPTSSVYLVGAMRSLKMLQNTAAMIELFSSSDQRARDWEALAYYGYALYRTGDERRARIAWEQSVNSMPRTEQSFRLLASLQIEAGARDAAASMLLDGRRVLGNRTLFATELIELAIAARNLSTALDEIFAYFDATQNLARTQGYISALLTFGNSEREIRQRIEAYVRSHGDVPSALRLEEWFFREVGDYPSALDVVVRLDRLAGNSGRDIYSFAERARVEGAYDVALSAYGKLLSLPPTSDIRALALYGYAQTIEQKTLQSARKSWDDIARIIAEYERIVRDAPNSMFAANALLRIAELTRDYADDPLSAIAQFERVLTQYPTTEQAARARIERLPLLVRTLGLDSTAALLERERPLILRFSTLSDEVLFCSGEFEFFRCRFEHALEQYRNVSRNLESPLANDAIERTTLITTNRNDSISLCLLARAELAFYQLDWKNGFLITDSLAAQGNDLAEYALAHGGSIAVERNMLDRAERYYSTLIEQFPETIYADRALWGLGRIAEAKGEREQALRYYNELLARYPNSIYIPRVRSLIRSLRGDM
jgi:tetratricopeptide (TPR) repeat protein